MLVSISLVTELSVKCEHFPALNILLEKRVLCKQIPVPPFMSMVLAY